MDSNAQEEEVLWKRALPFGTELSGLQSVQEHNWSFSNLEDAFKEGGVLHGEKVFLFTSTEVQLFSIRGELKVTFIPVVAAIVSPCPPSNKIAIRDLGKQDDEVIHMEDVEIDWVPYFPVAADWWGGAAETQIFLLRHKSDASPINAINILQYCTPYFNNPFKTEEEPLFVDINCPDESGEEPFVVEYNCEFDDPEKFTDEFINDGKVDKDAFKELIKKKVEATKIEASRKRFNAREELMRQGIDAAAFEEMRFYKFYPVAIPDTPNISSRKSPHINGYYGKAHLVF
ncbi:hypothetical protein SSX86_019352 [Deinandra increscens subsp. villosa]|uniref:Uncharacterized protein n=1 Tax=Deinandra increscens subsp. villosa TaxID=3103831 RepID=A0AAP0CU36_9ASTR